MSASVLTIALDRIAVGALHPAELDGAKIVLVRDGDAVRAFAGKCPHAGAPLEKGVLCEGAIVCPWHKAVFSLEDGAVHSPPALAGLARYRVEVADGMVTVSGEPIPAVPARGRPAPGGDEGRIAIVGTGAAAAAAITELHARGAAGRLTVIGREKVPPYDRTALSKMVVAGKMPPASKPLLPDGALAAPVERVVGEVVRVDASSRRITLSDGRTIDYDRALVASGSAARRPDIPGRDLPGVHVLRNVDDAAALVETIGRARRAVVLGAGFVGLEAAAGLIAREMEVTVVEPEAVPFAKRLGERIGARIKAIHEAKGVVFRTGRPRAIEGRPGAPIVVLEDGARLESELVLAGLGASPEAGFVEGVTRHEGGAIEADAGLAAAPGLWLAGDIARFPLDGGPVRIEHWQVAEAHGIVAARNMLGDDVRYDDVPFFWTAHHGKRFEVLGHAESWDEIAYDGDVEADDFVAYMMVDGTVRSAIGCGRDAAMARLKRAMRRRLTLDAAREAAGAA